MVGWMQSKLQTIPGALFHSLSSAFICFHLLSFTFQTLSKGFEEANHSMCSNDCRQGSSSSSSERGTTQKEHTEGNALQDRTSLGTNSKSHLRAGLQTLKSPAVCSIGLMPFESCKKYEDHHKFSIKERECEMLRRVIKFSFSLEGTPSSDSGGSSS